MTIRLFSLLTVTLAIIFLVPVDAAPSASPFVGKLLKKETSALRKVAREMPTPSKMVDTSDLKKLLPAADAVKVDKSFVHLVAIGDDIAARNPYGKKFINSVSEPLDAISQYGRYGDDYLKTTERITKTVVKDLPALKVLRPEELKKIFPIAPSSLSKLGSEVEVMDACVDVLRRTGNKGYQVLSKISSWAADHPGSVVAAAAFAWYYTDPEGFLDTVKDVSQFLAEGVLKGSQKVGEGMVEAAIETVKTKGAAYIPFGVVLIACFALLLSALGRRILFFPFRLLALKIDAVMKEKEAKLSKQGPSSVFSNESGVTSASPKNKDKKPCARF